MKKYLTEFIGTFFLVLVIGLTGNPFAIGAMLMVMVYMGGNISGAHYNPAVSLGLIIRGKMDSKETFMYILSQLTGAIAASLFCYLLTGKTFAPAPAEGVSLMKALVVEIVFTFALMLVILNVATSNKAAGNSYYGLAIGFTVLAAAFAGGGISGGAYNPAVGIGPALIDTMMGSGSLKNVWIYVIGPCTGAVVAALVYKIANPDE